MNLRVCLAARAPGVAEGRIGRPHHGYAAGLIPQLPCNLLEAGYVVVGLLTPCIPCSIHLMSIPHHHKTATLYAQGCSELQTAEPAACTVLRACEAAQLLPPRVEEGEKFIHIQLYAMSRLMPVKLSCGIFKQ